ncbi:MAG: hypothetical protein ABSA11_04025 [Candidatus Bathyarchaeia archaeon]|jgi:hypothetical protein
MARAHSILGDLVTAKEHIERAREAAVKIVDDGNRKYLLAELKSVKI